jgi:hypothetical protein
VTNTKSSVYFVDSVLSTSSTKFCELLGDSHDALAKLPALLEVPGELRSGGFLPALSECREFMPNLQQPKLVFSYLTVY